MEFRFNINEVFNQPIIEIGHTLIPTGFKGDRRALWDALSKVTDIVNAMGSASATAQGLTKPITTADRLRNSEQQTLYLLLDQGAYNGKGAVTGMLKTGKKGLYVFDRDGHHYQVQAPCILDFYVHETKQRSGFGKLLFEHMLKKEDVQPVKLAIDRPSDKFLGFLTKHYQLNKPIRQMNNYVVYDGFFPEVKNQTSINNNGDTPSKRAANGLQHQTVTSPYGRYGAPRPPCSMGQIIHNQSAAVTPQEPSGHGLNIKAVQPKSQWTLPHQMSNQQEPQYIEKYKDEQQHVNNTVSAPETAVNHQAGDSLFNNSPESLKIINSEVNNKKQEYYWPFNKPTKDYLRMPRQQIKTGPTSVHDLMHNLNEKTILPIKVDIDQYGRPIQCNTTQHYTPEMHYISQDENLQILQNVNKHNLHSSSSKHKTNYVIEDSIPINQYNHFNKPVQSNISVHNSMYHQQHNAPHTHSQGHLHQNLNIPSTLQQTSMPQIGQTNNLHMNQHNYHQNIEQRQTVPTIINQDPIPVGQEQSYSGMTNQPIQNIPLQQYNNMNQQALHGAQQKIHQHQISFENQNQNIEQRQTSVPTIINQDPMPVGQQQSYSGITNKPIQNIPLQQYNNMNQQASHGAQQKIQQQQISYENQNQNIEQRQTSVPTIINQDPIPVGQQQSYSGVTNQPIQNIPLQQYNNMNQQASHGAQQKIQQQQISYENQNNDSIPRMNATPVVTYTTNKSMPIHSQPVIQDQLYVENMPEQLHHNKEYAINNHQQIPNISSNGNLIYNDINQPIQQTNGAQIMNETIYRQNLSTVSPPVFEQALPIQQLSPQQNMQFTSEQSNQQQNYNNEYNTHQYYYPATHQAHLNTGNNEVTKQQNQMNTMQYNNQNLNMQERLLPAQPKSWVNNQRQHNTFGNIPEMQQNIQSNINVKPQTMETILEDDNNAEHLQKEQTPNLAQQNSLVEPHLYGNDIPSKTYTKSVDGKNADNNSPLALKNNMIESERYLKGGYSYEPLLPTPPAHLRRNSSPYIIKPCSREIQRQRSANVGLKDTLNKQPEKPPQRSINSLQRNITAATRRNIIHSPLRKSSHMVVNCRDDLESRCKDKPNAAGESHMSKTFEPEISQPKLDRPQTLSLHTSSDIIESEVHNDNLSGDELDNIENDVENLEITENAAVDSNETPVKKTPSHLTEQGYFDLKFYHNKLW